MSAAPPPPSSKRRFVLLLLAGLVIVLALFFGLRLHLENVRAENLAGWKARLQGMADDRKMGIEGWLHERLSDARLLAAYHTTRALLSGAPGEGEEGTARHLSEEFANLVAEGPYTGGSIRNAEGRALVAAGDSGASGETVRKLSARMLEKRETFRIDLTSQAGAAPALIFLVPIPGTRGDTAGIVALISDPNRWLYPFLRRELGPPRTVECLLCRRDSDRILVLNRLRHSSAEPFTIATPYDRPGSAGRLAVDGISTFGEFVDYRGVEVLAATRHIASTDWGLVVKVDRAEALASHAEMTVSAAVASAALVVALLGVAFGLWRNEHLRSLADVARREQRIRLVMEQANDGFMFVRPSDGRILEANRAAVQMYGYSADELTGMTVAELRVPEERAALPAQMAQALEKGIVVETRHRRKDGSVFPVEVSVRGVDLGGEKVLFATLRDVSEWNAAFQRIECVSRLLRTISEISELIVREKDKERILSRSCQIIVEEAGFRMAWIGLPDRASQEIVPVASAGVVDGYLDSIHITFDDSPLGRGPAGTAVREKRPVVCNDWDADERLSHWRQKAAERGYRASASLPIQSGDEVSGVLTVYAGEPGSFTPEVVTLLEELADDIGFALESIETERLRARAEATLAESEARYRLLFEANPRPILVHDLEGLSFLAVNEAAVAQYGYSREEFLGMTIRDIRPAEDVAALDQLVSTLRPGISYSGTWRHRRKDGSLIDVEITSHSLDFSGRPARLAVANDITERKKAEEAFARSEMMLGEAQRIAGIGSWEWTIRGNQAVWSPNMRRLFGVDPEEALPETSEGGYLNRFVHPDDRAHVAQTEERSLQTGTPYEIEYRIRRADGAERIVVERAEVRRDSEGGVIGLFGTIQDVTERRRREVELRESEQRFAAFMERLPAVAFIKDEESRIVFANAYMGRLFGPVDTLGKRNDEFLPPEVAMPMIEEDRRVFGDGPLVVQQAFQDAKGRAHVFQTHKFPISLQGRPSLLGGIGIDVTEQVRAQEEVRRLNEELEARVQQRTAQLEAANREMEAFSYSVSHDLRAPLRAIDGFSKMIAMSNADRLDAEGTRLFGVIRKNTARMSELIDDLLALSRVGRHEIRHAPIEMRDLVERVWQDLVAHSPEPPAELRLASLPRAYGDPRLVRQLWENLLSNALKFSSKRERRLVEVGGSEEGDKTSFFVKDNGAGFDMEYAYKLFGVFQRLHVQAEFEGTGVGLAIVRRIVERHEGRVWATGEVGAGATFFFTLGSERGER